MLRKHDNVRVHFAPDLFTGTGWVTLLVGERGEYRLGRIHKKQWAEGREFSRAFPMRVTELYNRTYWVFQGEFYSTEDSTMEATAVHEVLMMRARRAEAQRDEVLSVEAPAPAPIAARARIAVPTPRTTPALHSVSEDVKEAVWLRDRGRCTNCGANEDLEFDHIIPSAMGGPSTEDNIQVLCNPCHRIKGAVRAHGGVRRRSRVPFEQ